MSSKLFFALGALLFAGCAAFGIKVGRFKTQVFKRDPYIRRRDEPHLFWTYASALGLGAALLGYMAVFATP